MRWLPDDLSDDNLGERVADKQTKMVIDEKSKDNLQKPLIMIVDDNADMRQYIARLLFENYRIATAPDGEAALEQILKSKPDLVLSDVMMPRMDGFGLIQALRNNPATQHVPVIMLSARAGEESRIDGMDASADDYLVKPFSARELLARVASHLKIARLRNESAEAVSASEKKLRMAIEAAQMVTWDWELSTNKVLLSSNANEIFGLPQNSGMEKIVELFNLIYEEDLGHVKSVLNNSIENFCKFNLEFRIVRPDTNDINWFEGWGYTIGDDSRKAARIVAVAKNVTKQKLAEKALLNSENQLRAVIENTPECIKILDHEGTLLQMNNAGKHLLEVEQNTCLTGRSIFDVIAPEYCETFRAFNEKICLGESGTLEFDILGFKGTRRHMESHAVPLPETNGKYLQLALTRDVTARKHAEQAVRNERDLLNITFRSIGDAVITTDNDALITNMNVIAEKLTGWSLSEAAGQPLEDIFHIINETSRKTVANPIVRALQEGVIVGLANHTILIRKDGFEYPIDDSAAPILNQHGTVMGAVLVFRDISERKMMEDALRKSEARFRNMADIAPTMLWETDSEGLCTFISRVWYECTGQTENEGLGLGWVEALHPDDRKHSQDIFKEAVLNKSSFSFEYRLKQKNGEYRWAIGSGRPRFDESGKYLGYVGGIIDINERKQAEDFCSSQARILEMITNEESIINVLHELVNLIERQIPGSFGSILLLDAQGKHLHHGAAPRLPESYNQAIDGVEIGPEVGSCGTVIYKKQRIIVNDIGNDPLWVKYCDIALSHGLRACWSEPIRSADGSLLGTFAIYFQQVRSPEKSEIASLEALARFAGIAIDRPRAQEALRKSEQRF
ncbi:MAG: PAS domain S-box protein, partial [Candidatus Nitrotoga sp.]